jgi:hypothetical protein
VKVFRLNSAKPITNQGHRYFHYKSQHSEGGIGRGTLANKEPKGKLLSLRWPAELCRLLPPNLGIYISRRKNVQPPVYHILDQQGCVTINN